MVAAELLVGAPDEAAWRRWHERWVLPAERVGRVLVPDRSAWLRASRIVARLAESGAIERGRAKAGFFNDCLLAASAREQGFTLITWNRADFEMISRVEPTLRAVAPLP